MNRREIPIRFAVFVFRFALRQYYKLENYESRGDNVVHGKFRVLYLDGRTSERMSWKTAKGYAKIFQGKVIDAF